VQLAGYGTAPGPESPPIVPVPVRDEAALAAAGRVWVLARNRGQRNALLAGFDVPHARQPPSPRRGSN